MRIRVASIAALAILLTQARAGYERLAQIELELARQMFKPTQEAIRNNYYDVSFSGLDFERIFRDGEGRIAAGHSNTEVLQEIALTVGALHSKQTYFVPPARRAEVRYGWHLHVVGKATYVDAVEPGSDAEKQGIKPGERLVRVNNIEASRDNLADLRYLLVVLSPQKTLEVTVAAVDGTLRTIRFSSAIRIAVAHPSDSDALNWSRTALNAEEIRSKWQATFKELSPETVLWKQPGIPAEDDLGAYLRRVSKYQNVILDLRGNPGGSTNETLELIGAFSREKRPVWQVNRRTGSTSVLPAQMKSVPGKLYVLIDGSSGGGAELFARAMQLESRGTVLGDRSAGIVNESVFYPLFANYGGDLLGYGVSVATGAIVMNDGQPLEGVGVTPDVWLVPSAKDLAAGDDPVLAAAARLAGLTLTKQQAGEITRNIQQWIYD